MSYQHARCECDQCGNHMEDDDDVYCSDCFGEAEGQSEYDLLLEWRKTVSDSAASVAALSLEMRDLVERTDKAIKETGT